ncbi:MAG: carboxypeptidase regulatory-like domain-containing protein [Planctomycetes bacterium]|nr:carboxypeptidase regulatory-like domain-containing protein [Planctomycetota bacterium]
MSRRFALGIFCLVAIALVVWVLLPDAKVELDPIQESAQIQTGTDSDSVASVDAKANPTEGQGEQRSAALPETGEPVAADIQAHYQGADAITLSVVDDRNGKPVPNADVFLMASDDLDFEHLNNSKAGKFDYLKQNGAHFVSDESGKVHLNPDALSIAVFARHGEKFAFKSPMDLGNDERELRLIPNSRLHVTVMNETGQTLAGFPVSTFAGSGTQLFETSRQDSDLSGGVVLEDVANDRQSTLSFGKLFVGSGAVGMSPPGVGEYLVEVTEEVLKTGKLTLLATATGQVVVQVLTDQELPETEPGIGMLHLLDRSRNSRPTIYSRLPNQAGTFEYSHVGLGAELQFSFRGDRSSNQEFLKVQGPKTPGEVVVVKLTRPHRASVSGILIQPDGLPLSNAEIIINEVYDQPKPFGSGFVKLQTDEVGGFQYQLREQLEREVWEGPDAVKRKPSSLEALVITSTVECNVQLYARVVVGVPNEPKEIQLGEIQLAKTKPLVVGLVVDGDGMPISNVGVRFRWKPMSSEDNRGSQELPGVYVKTDRDGRFVAYGLRPDAREYIIQIQRKGYQRFEQVLQPSADEQQFVLVANPAIRGTILVDEGVLPNDLRYQAASGERKLYRIGGRITSTGDPTRLSLDFSGAIDQPFTFNILTMRSEVLFQSQEFRLMPGQILAPPELNPLDLRGKLKVFTVSCEDKDGNPLPCSFEILSGERTRTSFGWESSEKRFAVVEPLPSLRVSAPGYISGLSANVQSDTVITLQKAIAAQLQIAGQFLHYRDGLVGIEGGYFIAENGRYESISHSDLDENGNAEIFFPKPGEYSVSLGYTPRFGSERSQRRSHDFGKTLFRVEGDGQILVIDIDQAELDRLIDGLLQKASEEGGD